MIMKIVKSILRFLKKEPVFTAALILAAVSFCIVRPGVKVIEGIDFRTLSLLLVLMCVVAGLQKQFLFEKIGNALITKISDIRLLYMILILLCFVSSMFMTNDVALITFVPFSVLILTMLEKSDKLALIVVLQTLAANLGSILTPLGNPQNLYLYNLSGMSALDFIKYMLPLWLISLVLVTVPVIFMKKEKVSGVRTHETPDADKPRLVMYIVLFALSILSVLKILDYRILLAIAVVAILVADRVILLKADYVLLGTFVGFFVFIYDLKQIPEVVDAISSVVKGHELPVGIIASQFISNVPAAILLSGFTNDIKTLLVSVNLGGLGTLIASMASLISYKFYVSSKNSKPGRYMLKFTAFNVAYLIVLTGLSILIY